MNFVHLKYFAPNFNKQAVVHLIKRVCVHVLEGVVEPKETVWVVEAVKQVHFVSREHEVDELIAVLVLLENHICRLSEALGLTVVGVGQNQGSFREVQRFNLIFQPRDLRI